MTKRIPVNNVLLAKKMRQSVLQAAIEGKLTEQNSEEDGSAKDLLAQIETEKERLIADGGIKRSRALPPISDDEVPFDIPDNWEWVRLDDVFEIARGGSPRPIKQYITDKEDGVNWIKIGDTDIGGKYIESCNEKIRRDGINKSRYVNSGDLLLTNSMSYGRPYILKVDGCIHDGWLSLKPYSNQISKEYFYYLISSSLVKTQFNNTVSGAVVKNLNKDKVKGTVVPLPPLAEQERIVTKLENILTQIDALEAHENELHKLQLVFPKQMQASLLQAAIEGKLTEQDSDEDGSAKDLLTQIEIEKERLIADGEMKRPKSLPPITDDQVPFDIPNNWEWVRLGELCCKVGSGSTPPGGRTVYKQSGVKFIRSQNVHNDGLKLDGIAYIDEQTHNKKPGSKIFAKDILMNITGASIGRACIVPDDFDTANTNQHVLHLRLIEPQIRKYLHIVLTSPFVFNSIMSVQVGGTKEGLSATKAKELLVPLPPLFEQKRIVNVLNKVLPEIQELKDIQ